MRGLSRLRRTIVDRSQRRPTVTNDKQPRKRLATDKRSPKRTPTRRVPARAAAEPSNATLHDGEGVVGSIAEAPAPVVADVGSAAPFPIVGIGASAGGLAAFEAFFAAMPQHDDTGMAFVLVQHLSPGHKSVLVDLVR